MEAAIHAATYAITALRWHNTDIDEAMVGLIDPQRTEWDLAPAPARVNDLVDKLVEGDRVVTLFPDAHGRWLLGPEVKVTVLPGGAETLSLAEDAQGRRLDDLPRY